MKVEAIAPPGASPATFEPKPAQLQELIEKATALDIKFVFAKPQFSTRSAERIAREIGGRVVLVDPLAID